MAAPQLPPATYAAFNAQLTSFDSTKFLIESDAIRGNQKWIRSPYVDLPTVEFPSTLDSLTIYSDTLHATSPASVFEIPPNGYLTLFARSLLCASTTDAPIRFKTNGPCGITLHTAHTSPFNSQVYLSIETSSAVKPVALSFDHNTVGQTIVIQADGSHIVEPHDTPPQSEFGVSHIFERLTEDGTLASLGFKHPDDLRRILQYQLLLAAFLREKRPQAAADMAGYVAKMTFGIGKAVETHLQATTFLASICLSGPTSRASRFVQPLDLTSAKTVLKSRLVAAVAFERSYQEFVKLAIDSTNIQVMAGVALGAAQDAEDAYQFIGRLTKKRYDEAEAAFEKAQGNFNTLQKDLDGLQKKFKEGIESWKKKQILKAVGESLLAAVKVVGSIAAAVVAPPAGVVGVGVAADGVAKAADVAEKVSKVSAAIAKVMSLYETMKPILEKLKDVIDAIKNTMELIGKLGTLSKIDDKTSNGFKVPDVGAIDTVDVGRQWDEFELETDVMMKFALEESIDGAAEYHLALKKMVARARAILSAQNNLTRTSDEHIKTLTQQVASERQRERLAAAIKNLSDPAVFNIYKESFLESLFAMRTWVYLDFTAYISAYMYFSLDDTSPIDLSPVKSIAKYTNDAALLQAAVAQSEVKNQAQRDTITLAPDDLVIVGGNGESDWKRTLASERSVTFTIRPEHPLFRSYARIRVNYIRCYLDGLAGTGPRGAVRLDITFDGNLIDRKSAETLVSFITPPRRVAFQYLPETNNVLMDGAMAKPGAFLKPTPFTTWTVSIPDDNVDLAVVRSMRVVMECEVTVL